MRARLRHEQRYARPGRLEERSFEGTAESTLRVSSVCRATERTQGCETMQGASVGRGVRALRELRGVRSFASAPLGSTTSSAEAQTAATYSDAMYVPPKPMLCQLTQCATVLPCITALHPPTALSWALGCAGRICTGLWLRGRWGCSALYRYGLPPTPDPRSPGRPACGCASGRRPLTAAGAVDAQAAMQTKVQTPLDAFVMHRLHRHASEVTKPLRQRLLRYAPNGAGQEDQDGPHVCPQVVGPSYGRRRCCTRRVTAGFQGARSSGRQRVDAPGGERLACSHVRLHVNHASYWRGDGLLRRRGAAPPCSNDDCCHTFSFADGSRWPEQGLPFFFTKLPGAPKDARDKKLAGNAFKVPAHAISPLALTLSDDNNAWKPTPVQRRLTAKGIVLQVHKLAGQAFEYLVPLHVGAVGLHAVKGQNILSRLAPFASKTA